ncbi:RHS repeat-associated core domain-containing protein [Microbulbifer sp. JMSA003]|uniref:RHS repeat-associated core domain-containing protein n=1 Tax=Microbulbifer sp. JMSA003 TaxID=3243369 RepID=UPI004039DF42
MFPNDDDAGSESITVSSNGVYTYELQVVQRECYSLSESFPIKCEPWGWKPQETISDGTHTVNVAFLPNPSSSVNFKSSTTDSSILDRDGAFTVQWGASSSSTSKITGYQWCQKTNGSWQSISSCPYVGTGTLSRDKSGLSDASYQYRVRAYSKTGSYYQYSGWEYSPTITVAKPPANVATIYDPSVPQPVNSSFYLQWSSVSGATHYEFQCLPPGGQWGDSACSNSSVSSASQLIELEEGDSGNYKFRVRACITGAKGCSIGWAEKEIVVNVPLTPPAAPEITAPARAEKLDYEISWNTPVGATSYELKRARYSGKEANCTQESDGFCWVNVPLSQTSKYRHQGGEPDKYKYKLRAYKQNVPSIWSESNWIDVHNLNGIDQPAAVSTVLATQPGSIPYSAHVSPQGDAIVRVPLQVAPGINGLVPNLSILYSGARYRQRHNQSLPEDTMGYGWRLGGLSSIRRCVTGRPDTDKISLNASDSICLDGEPLVLLSGTHWEAGARYRTLRDSFKLIELKETADDKLWFEVKAPDGRTSQYGFNSDSRLKAGQLGTFSPHFGWSLSKVTDAFGNQMEYKYHRDTVQGINYLLEILYGNNGDAKIEFQYGTRTDAPPIPLKTDEIEQEQLVLLHHIRVHLDNILQREYLLISEEEPANSDGSSHYRRLNQIQLCGYDLYGNSRDCLNPLEFDWSDSESNDGITAATGVSKVVDGVGQNVHFRYAKLSETDLFDELPFGQPIAPDVSEAEELPDEEGNDRILVSELHRTNGLSGRCTALNDFGCHITRYGYSGRGFVSNKHWGFLGYYAQRAYDTASDITTYRQYRLDFPYFGSVARLYQYKGHFPSHSEKLTEQAFEYDTASIALNGNSTLYPYLKASLDTVLEGGQSIGYQYATSNYSWLPYNQSGSGNVGELIESVESLQQAVTSASVNSSQSVWGDLQVTAGGAQRSTRSLRSFYHRPDAWLIGFVEAEEVSQYKGGITASPERVKTVIAAPYGSSNKAGVITQYPDDNQYELTITRSYDANGNLSEETVSAPDQADDRLDISSRSFSVSNFIDKRYPQSLTNEINHIVTVDYDPRFGAVSSVTDTNGRNASMTYDAFGRETKSVNADNVTFNTDYGFCGAGSCPVSGDMEAGYWIKTSSLITPTSTQYYDLLGRLIQQDTESFDGAEVSRQQYKYDERGLLFSVTEPFFYPSGIGYLTQYQYDERNRVKTITKPDTSIVKVDYVPKATDRQVMVQVTDHVADSLGNPAATHVTQSYYGLTGDLEKTIDDATGERVHSRFTYDGSGLLKSVILGSNGLDDPSTESTYQKDRAGYRTSMTDPNLGTVHSLYNALGQLVWQKDNKGQETTLEYDKLGRLLKQVDEEGTAEWEYDAANAKGFLKSRTYSEYGEVVFSESYIYASDSKLETITTNLIAGGESRQFKHQYGYDGQGRLQRVTYPNGIATYHQFNSQGYISSLSDNAAGNNPFKRFDTVNARGQAEVEIYGNGLVTSRTYDPKTGSLQVINTDSGRIQNNEYTWRSNGALESRLTMNSAGVIEKHEEFSYDNLNRLTDASLTVGGSRVLRTQYDDLGNILAKTSSNSGDRQVSDYQYGEFGNAGPNAVSTVNINGVAHSLHYDLNGAIEYYDATSGDDKWISWNARQLPTEIVLGSTQGDATPTAKDRFRYGPNGQRFYRESSWMEDGQLKTEKVFIVGGFEETLPLHDASIQKIQRVSLDSAVQHVAITDLSGTFGEFQYLHRDHQGSIEKITDAEGIVILNMGFDPHGSRRKVDWNGDITQDQLAELLLLQGYSTKRGYTGHEHLDRTGLIHMNGRIYDPTLGRFLSPDPIVQAPSNSQSWNRYSYVFNNPLQYTDPTGFVASDDAPPCEADCGTGSSTYESEVEVVGNPLTATEGWTLLSWGEPHSWGTTVINGNTYVWNARNLVRIPSVIDQIWADIASGATEFEPIKPLMLPFGNPTSLTPGGIKLGKPKIGAQKSPWGGFQKGVSIADPTIGAAQLFGVAAITSLVNRSGVNGIDDIRAQKWTPFPVANALDTSKSLQALKHAGAGLFYVSTAISLWNGSQALSNGNGFGVFNAGVDLAFGIAGFAGGTVGAVGAVSYGGTSAAIKYIPGVHDYIVKPGTDFLCWYTENC